MKIQQRRSVFETNSSSVHSITICKDEEYEAFISGKMYLNSDGKFTEVNDESTENRKAHIMYYIKEHCSNEMDALPLIKDKNDIKEICKSFSQFPFFDELDFIEHIFCRDIGLVHDEWLEMNSNTFQKSLDGITCFGFLD